MKALLIGDSEKSADVKKALAKNLIFSELACNPSTLEKMLGSAGFSCLIVDADAIFGCSRASRDEIFRILKRSKKKRIFVTNASEIDIINAAKSDGADGIIFRPFSAHELAIRVSSCSFGKSRISCIGGGTGLFNILTGLKKIPDASITSIVTMTDSGGSSGRLRESFGALPPGDIRMSLVALSNASDLMNRMLQYRFASGGECFNGHNVGNIVLVALSEICGSMKEGIKNLGEILNVQGIVAPVTMTNATLKAQFEDGTIVAGEMAIDLGEGRSPDLHVARLWHEPQAECNEDAYASIIFSDAVIIGPGDLYTSVITNLIVHNIAEAIAKTTAKRIYVCNLMTKPGETAHYGACDHIKEIIKYLKGDYLDYIIISNTALSRESLDRYAKKEQFQVKAYDIEKIREITKAKIILADVGHETELIRHDSDKIKDVIEKILVDMESSKK